MNIKQPYRLPELKEKISSGEYGAELMLQHAMLIIDEYRNQCITDSARIATLESQLRVVTDDRDGWVKQCSDRIDDALEFAKESDEREEEINSLKEILHEHRNWAVEVVAKLLRVHENRSEPESREIAKSLLAEKS